MTARPSTSDEQAEARNATVELILARRSTREGYSDRKVPDDVITQIIRCGLAAPSSKNARPWKFHVVTDGELLAELANCVATAEGGDAYVPIDPETGKRRPDWPSTVAESAAVLAAAPVGVFIENLGAFSKGRATLADVPKEDLPECLFGFTLEVMGVGAALMNMWTAANALGVQAAFMGDVCVAESAISERLGIVNDLVGVLVLGYSDATPPANRAVEDVSDTSHVTWRRAAGSE